MGARSFESDLRRRLLWLVLPTIAGVAALAVAVTWWALARADEASARFKAHALLVALDTELAEGDEPGAAAREVLDEVEGEGVRASLRGGALAAGSTTRAAPRPSVARSCALVHDEGWWRGCGAANGAYEAYVELPVKDHVHVVETLAASMAAVVLLAFVAVRLAARAAMRKPLEAVGALARWSERVAARAESPPPPAPEADAEELRRLAGSLEALVGRLTDALARERATSAHIAHELRTPLTALRADLEALGDPRVGPLLGDVDRLARVIAAILLLASPSGDEAGDVVNVADVARSLAPEGATIDAPDEALIRADERLVELALVNLLENAQTHGGRAASALRVTRVDAGVRVAVIDEGTGVEPEALARLFERHWRGPGSSGAGLGLALVSAVALRYDGSVDAAPGPGGRGLEVGITFGRVLGWA